MGAANEKSVKTTQEKPQRESIRKKIKESLKRRKPKALCTPDNVEFDDSNIKQQITQESAQSFSSHYSSSMTQLSNGQNNLYEQIKVFWNISDEDFQTLDIQEQLKETIMNQENETWNCYHFQLKYKNLNNPLYTNLLNSLKPFKIPICLYKEDILDDYLTSQFQLSLISDFTPQQNQQYLGEECISYLLETDQTFEFQLLLELRWVMINQKSFDLSFKNIKVHSLLQIIFEFQQIVLNHCKFCKIILESIKSIPLIIKLYTFFWNSFVRSIQQLDPLISTYLYHLEQCFNFFYEKPKQSPKFNTQYFMTKIWAQTLNIKKYQLYLQDESLKDTIDSRDFFAFCDIWFNQHSVNWIGHSGADYPKELLIFNENLISAIQKEFLNVYGASNLIKFYNEQSDKLKKLVGEVYYQLFFQKMMDDCLTENLKISLSSTIITLSQDIEKGIVQQESKKNKEEDQEEEIKDQQIDQILSSQIIFKSVCSVSQNIRKGLLLLEIISQVLRVKLDDKQGMSSVSMVSSQSTQLASQLSSNYGQMYKAAQLIRGELEKLDSGLCQFVDQVEDMQVQRMKDIQQRNNLIELRNEQKNVEQEIGENGLIFYNFQRKITFVQLFEFCHQKSLNASEYLQCEEQTYLANKKDNNTYSTLQVQQNIDQNLAYHINKNHFK